MPLVYIVLTVFETQRTAYAASAAARSAGRALLTAPDEASARPRAHAAARMAFEDQVTDAPMNLQISCRPEPTHCLTPGNTVTVAVVSRAALPLIPSFLGDNVPSIRVESSHSAPYGAFREQR